MAGKSSYGWIITEDLIEANDSERTDEGVAGPRELDRETLASLKKGGGEAFQLFDDDKELCYRGRFIDNDGTADGFEPLEDFGTPNAGCIIIKYRNKDTSKWEVL